MPKLKKLKEGEPFPADFWNYKINPILGYEYEVRRSNANDIKRYQQTNKGIV